MGFCVFYRLVDGSRGRRPIGMVFVWVCVDSSRGLGSSGVASFRCREGFVRGIS